MRKILGTPAVEGVVDVDEVVGRDRGGPGAGEAAALEHGLGRQPRQDLVRDDLVGEYWASARRSHEHAYVVHGVLGSPPPVWTMDEEIERSLRARLRWTRITDRAMEARKNSQNVRIITK
jgi:hypothetical protein